MLRRDEHLRPNLRLFWYQAE